MKSQSTKQNHVLLYFIAIIASIISSLLLIIFFAFCIKWFNLPDKYISPVNLAIKAISISIGLMFLLKEKRVGLAKGTIFGAVYFLMAFLLFSALAGSIGLSLGAMLDLAYCVVVGAIAGILIVNIKK